MFADSTLENRSQYGYYWRTRSTAAFVLNHAKINAPFALKTFVMEKLYHYLMNSSIFCSITLLTKVTLCSSPSRSTLAAVGSFRVCTHCPVFTYSIYVAFVYVLKQSSIPTLRIYFDQQYHLFSKLIHWIKRRIILTLNSQILHLMKMILNNATIIKCLLGYMQTNIVVTVRCVQCLHSYCKMFYMFKFLLRVVFTYDNNEKVKNRAENEKGRKWVDL